MVAKAVPAKRKQTVDMADSPPKRVTRARAAKGLEESAPKEQKKKSTVASTKAAVSERKAPPASAAPAEITRRKVQFAIPEESMQDSEILDQPMPAPTRTRQKKATQTEVPSASADVPKSRSRQPKAKVGKPQPDATTSRGRPRRAAPAEEEEPAAEQVMEEDVPKPAPVKKAARGRGAVSTSSKSTTVAAATKSSISKKKVQVQDEDDKENVPIEATGPKKSAIKPTGMRAKPVRKPAAPRATTRGKKALEQASVESEKAKSDTLPLSPKKINQVTKTPSSSEDELSGAKTPIKTPAKSPAKVLASPSRVTTSVSKLTLGNNTVPPSPWKQTSVLGSPARRAPQSPFKDSMKASPKKLNLGENVARPALSNSQAGSPVKTSLLQVSPRKGNLPDNTIHSMLPPAHAPLKASLLQSPARRPMNSPFRVVAPASGNKSSKAPVSLQASPRKVPLFSSSSAVSSPLHTAEIPSHVAKAHETPDDEREIPQDEGEHGQEVFEIEQAASPLASNFTVEQIQQSDNIEDGMELQGPGESLQGPSTVSTMPVPLFASMARRRISLESQLSEDELASPDKKYAPTPLRKPEFSFLSNHTPTIASEGASLTPLADQFGNWAASSPDETRPSRQQRGIFSLAGSSMLVEDGRMNINACEEPAVKSSFFEDEMAIIDVGARTSTPERIAPSDDAVALQTSMDSQSSQEYGDENAIPTEAEMLRAEQEANDPTLTCTPAKVFTPARQVTQQPREIYTVSKVPLRPSADGSPVKLPRQRSKSLGEALRVLADDAVGPEATLKQPATPTLTATDLPQTPSSGMKLDVETPGRTGRKSATSSVLKGAIVHVDVHTTEGADASGIFIDLLTQMGARCVKQWNWSPRLSMGDSLDSAASPQGTSLSGMSSTCKIGITHVVYKDGGKRTLEKVRLSDGVVMCVGVGWVLE